MKLVSHTCIYASRNQNKLYLRIRDCPVLIITIKPVIATGTIKIGALKVSISLFGTNRNFFSVKSPPLSKLTNWYVVSHVSLQSGFYRIKEESTVKSWVTAQAVGYSGSRVINLGGNITIVIIQTWVLKSFTNNYVNDV